MLREFSKNNFERTPSLPEGHNREILNEVGGGGVIDAHVGLGTRTMSPARPSFDASPTSDEWSGGENFIFIFFFSNHRKARGSMSLFAAHAHIVPDNEHIIILHLNTTNSSSREAFSLRDSGRRRRRSHSSHPPSHSSPSDDATCHANPWPTAATVAVDCARA